MLFMQATVCLTIQRRPLRSLGHCFAALVQLDAQSGQSEGAGPAQAALPAGSQPDSQQREGASEGLTQQEGAEGVQGQQATPDLPAPQLPSAALLPDGSNASAAEASPAVQSPGDGSDASAAEAAPAAAAPAAEPASTAEPAQGDLAAFMAAFQELRKWVDTAEAQYAGLHAQHEARQGRPATALK